MDDIQPAAAAVGSPPASVEQLLTEATARVSCLETEVERLKVELQKPRDAETLESERKQLQKVAEELNEMETINSVQREDLLSRIELTLKEVGDNEENLRKLDKSAIQLQKLRECMERCDELDECVSKTKGFLIGQNEIDNLGTKRSRLQEKIKELEKTLADFKAIEIEGVGAKSTVKGMKVGWAVVSAAILTAVYLLRALKA